MNILEKLLEMRKGFLASDMKKSATNSFAKFKYYTLEDILPVMQSLCEEHKVLVSTSFEYDDNSKHLFRKS